MSTLVLWHHRKVIRLTLTCYNNSIMTMSMAHYDMILGFQMSVIYSVHFFQFGWCLCEFQDTEVLTALREISKLDREFAHQLWVMLIPLLWSNLEVEEKERLTDSIVTLLAKDWHYKQRHQRPNVVKTLLESISLCQPLPRLPSLLVTFLGKKYGACQVACSILGSSIPNDPEVCMEILHSKIIVHVNYRMLSIEKSPTKWL